MVGKTVARVRGHVARHGPLGIERSGTGIRHRHGVPATIGLQTLGRVDGVGIGRSGAADWWGQEAGIRSPSGGGSPGHTRRCCPIDVGEPHRVDHAHRVGGRHRGERIGGPSQADPEILGGRGGAGGRRDVGRQLRRVVAGRDELALGLIEGDARQDARLPDRTWRGVARAGRGHRVEGARQELRHAGRARGVARVRDRIRLVTAGRGRAPDDVEIGDRRRGRSQGVSRRVRVR